MAKVIQRFPGGHRVLSPMSFSLFGLHCFFFSVPFCGEPINWQKVICASIHTGLCWFTLGRSKTGPDATSGSKSQKSGEAMSSRARKQSRKSFYIPYEFN